MFVDVQNGCLLKIGKPFLFYTLIIFVLVAPLAVVLVEKT